MFRISLKELNAFVIKSTKRSSDYFQMDDTISIVKTTQGANKNDGININIHVNEFLGYNFLKLYVIGNRLYLHPLNYNDVHYVSNECFALSQNPHSRCLNTKIGSVFGVEKLMDFVGEHHIKRDKDSTNQCNLFYIEK